MSDQLSEKCKQYLEAKLIECEKKIKKLKKKKRIYKILYYTSVATSICTTAILFTLSTSIMMPALVIPMLSTLSLILASVSIKFNFEQRSTDIHRLILKVNYIKQKIDYVIKCNGNMTKEEYDDIINNL